MHRADGRGLDRLDLSNPDFDRRLDVLVAGRGNNPQTNGMSAGLDNFAPRVGGIYRIDDNTVFRTGYGLTYNAQGVGARSARRQRLSRDDRVELLQRRTVRLLRHAPAGHSDASTGPDVSSGRVPLDRAAAEYTPEIDNIDRGYVHTWNVAFERRLPMDMSVDVAYVGAKGVGGYAALDINAPTVLGGGDASAALLLARALVAINSWGHRLKTQYNSLQIALNKPFTHGLLLKGAYTLSKAMNESERRRPGDADVEHAQRTRSQLGAGRLRSPAQLAAGIRVSARRGRPRTATANVAQAIVSDWQLNGVFAAFSGNPFTVTAQRHVA